LKRERTKMQRILKKYLKLKRERNNKKEEETVGGR
jgi:hypothetical protein